MIGGDADKDGQPVTAWRGNAAEGVPPTSIPPSGYQGGMAESFLATDAASGAVVLAGATNSRAGRRVRPENPAQPRAARRPASAREGVGERASAAASARRASSSPMPTARPCASTATAAARRHSRPARTGVRRPAQHRQGGCGSPGAIPTAGSFVTRSNKAASAFEPVQKLKLPGGALTFVQCEGSAGPVDLFASGQPNSGFLHTHVLAQFALRAQASKGKVTVSVRDAGRSGRRGCGRGRGQAPDDRRTRTRVADAAVGLVLGGRDRGRLRLRLDPHLGPMKRRVPHTPEARAGTGRRRGSHRQASGGTPEAARQDHSPEGALGGFGWLSRGRERGRAALARGCRACGRRAPGSPRPSCAHEHLRGDRLVRQTVGGEPCDAELGRAQLVRRPPDRDPAQLARRRARPRSRRRGGEELTRLVRAQHAPARFCFSRRCSRPWTRSVRARSNGIGQRSCSASARSSASAAASSSPSRREHQTPAAGRDRETPRDARAGRALLEAARAALALARASPTASAASIASPSTRQIAGSRKATRSNTSSASVRCRSAEPRLAGGELGQSEAAAPDRRDHRLPRSALAAASRTDSTRPAYASTYARQRCSGLRLDPVLPEGVDHAFGQLRRLGQVAGPGLDDHAIEQDVGERRLVALLARLLLRAARGARARRRGRRRSEATGRA